MQARKGITCPRNLKLKCFWRKVVYMSKYDDLPLFLSPAELAEFIGEHPSSIRRGIQAGRIPADKVNGKWQIYRDALFPVARSLIGEDLVHERSVPRPGFRSVSVEGPLSDHIRARYVRNV